MQCAEIAAFSLQDNVGELLHYSERAIVHEKKRQSRTSSCDEFQMSNFQTL